MGVEKQSMYVVAIGWLYVVTLMAFAEPTVVAGVLTFVFYGLAPVSLLFWLTGAFARRSAQRKSKRVPNPEQHLP